MLAIQAESMERRNRIAQPPVAPSVTAMAGGLPFAFSFRDATGIGDVLDDEQFN